MTPALSVEGVVIGFGVVAGPVLVAAVVPLAQVAGAGPMVAVSAAAALLVRDLAPLGVPRQRLPAPRRRAVRLTPLNGPPNRGPAVANADFRATGSGQGVR